MWQLASIAGVDPMRMTWGQLLDAFNVRCDFEWGRTSSLMALMTNLQREKGKRPLRPEDFYRPRHNRKKRAKRNADIGSLKAMFTKPA